MSNGEAERPAMTDEDLYGEKPKKLPIPKRFRFHPHPNEQAAPCQVVIPAWEKSPYPKEPGFEPEPPEDGLFAPHPGYKAARYVNLVLARLSAENGGDV